MAKLTDEEKTALTQEIIQTYGDKQYYELTAEQKEFCENSQSGFFKSMLNWKRLSINQYVYIIKALKEKPIQDLKQSTSEMVREAYFKKGQFSVIEDTQEKQIIEVYVNRYFQTVTVWNWGRTEHHFGHYECLCGENIIIVDCSQFSKNLIVGQLCQLKGKIEHRRIELTSKNREPFVGNYYLPYPCKIENWNGEIKTERNNTISETHEKTVPLGSGFNLLL